MRGGEPTVYWLRAGASEQLPVSLAAWRESFQAKEEAKPGEGAAAEAPGEAEPATPAEPEAGAPSPE
jgi:hypothetical protein